jgi:hypothetical protein
VRRQAIYVQVPEDGLAVAPYTQDTDLLLRTELLARSPRIDRVLIDLGFSLESDVGIWRRSDRVQVDLLVPEALGGPGRRAATLPEGYTPRAARKVRGLEAALYDVETIEVGALEPLDSRRVAVTVAGPGALLVAKLHKLGDRVEGGGSRLRLKDALDVYRLLRAFDAAEIASRLVRAREQPVARPTVDQAIALLRSLFGAESGAGVRMTVEAIGFLGDPDEIGASCVALADDILLAVSDEPAN